MPEDFQPGAAPDQWIGGPSGEAGSNTGQPLAAGSITLVSIGPSSVSLSATDATGGTPTYTYQWQRSTSPGGPFANIGNGLLTLNDSGLSAGTTYYYQLVYTDQTAATDTASLTVQTPAGLAVVSHPDYLVAWEPPSVIYVAGEKRPVKFTIVRKDGGLVQEPSNGHIYVTADGSTTPTDLTPDIEASGSQSTHTIAQDYYFATAGSYTVKAMVTIGNQIVGTETVVFINS